MSKVSDLTRKKTSHIFDKSSVLMEKGSNKMNSKFTEKQIEAYAKQFRVGDAIWCNGKWWEVVTDSKNLTNKLTINSNDNSFFINDGERYGFDAFLSGFTRTSKKPYRVTTLRDYKLQGDEIIVWLGESSRTRTFGKTYSVVDGHSYYNDKGFTVFISSSYWGIIPRYKQVKSLDIKDDEQLSIKVAEAETKKKLSIYEQVANRHNITKEELSFILDECDNGRKNYIINCLISLRSKWHENN